MEGTKFRLDLNLQRLSMISIAERLWHTPNIRNRIKNDFSDSRYWECYPGEIWYKISELVVQHGYVIGLPSTVAMELKKLIVIIGEKICKWIYYLTEELNLDFIFTEKIYFAYGAVNEIKVFDLYWRRMPADGFKNRSDYFEHTPFSLACIYGCESFINEYKTEMLEELSHFYREIRSGDEINNIMSGYICLTAKKSIADNFTRPQKMFEMCLTQGFSKAARYYWEKLNEIEKISKLIHFAEKCFQHNSRIFIREGNCENLLFLINQMQEEEKCNFFVDYADKIILMFLPVWPYHEMVVQLQVLKYDWNINSARSKEVLESLLEKLKCPIEKELLFQIIQKAWAHITESDKRDFLRCYCKRMFLTCDLAILNLVLNDPTIQENDFAKDFTECVKKSCVELVKIGKFDFINELTEKFFNFGPKPKELVKEDFPLFVGELIEKNEFDLVNQILDWSTESEEEKTRLKYQTNPIRICRCLTEQLLDFDLADKFLKWRFETDEEIKNFKEEMKSCNFVVLEYGYNYLRIKSGDLSYLRPGDMLSTHCDDDPFDNVDGLMFLKSEDADELNRGFVVGIPRIRDGSSTKKVIDFRRRDFSDSTNPRVVIVGTKPGDYILYNVCEIWKLKFWKEKYEMSENICNGFIKFYYETDEEVLQFKKTKLQLLDTENAIEVLYNLFFRRSLFDGPDILQDFFKFCQIPSEKIEEFKTQQRSHFEKLMDYYLLDQFDFDLADFCIRWLYDAFRDYKKEKMIKKNYLNSSNKGALLCVSYFEKIVESDPLHDESLAYQLALLLSETIDDMKKLEKDLVPLTENRNRTPVWFNDLLYEMAHSTCSEYSAARKVRYALWAARKNYRPDEF